MIARFPEGMETLAIINGELATPCRYFSFGKQAGFHFQFEKIFMGLILYY